MIMKKKVLIITESISYGGLNIASVNFQKYLDSDLFECVFCVRRDVIGELEQEVLDKGIRVIHVPDSKLGYLSSYRFYKKIMTDEHFDIVHCHLPFISGLILMAAKQCGVNKRIAHSHFSQPYTDTTIYSKKKQAIAVVYRMVMRILLKLFCNVKIACGENAGHYLYGKKEFDRKGIVLNNGIDTYKFIYDEHVRDSVRKELGIPNDATVLGHIGELYSVKNQSFIIDVFNEYHKLNENSYLLLIGDGRDREMLESKILDLKLEKNALMLGLRNDANRLYQAMDCFVFPSIHEGFPIVLIEAQTSNLACLVSDTITKTTKLSDNIEYMSINAPASDWAEKIDKIITVDRMAVDNSKVIKDYDIKNVSKELEEIYLK